MTRPPSFYEHCRAAFSPGARFWESCGDKPGSCVEIDKTQEMMES